MPYRVNSELPLHVRTHLPSRAQAIYRETFNQAYAGHAGEADREQRSHLIAWAAVKRAFVRAGGEWIARDEQDSLTRRA